MLEYNKEKYEALAEVIKAMAHASRLYILDALKEKPCSVGELTEIIGVDTSTISKHLNILKNAGIIKPVKDGNKVFYHLVCACVLDFHACVLKVIKTDTQIKTKQLEL